MVQNNGLEFEYLVQAFFEEREAPRYSRRLDPTTTVPIWYCTATARSP